jgi:hypothetical protein
MIRSLNKALSLLIAVVLLMSMTGVFATWQFTEHRVDPVYADIKMQVYMYNWDGSEELPDDTEGEDHIYDETRYMCMALPVPARPVPVPDDWRRNPMHMYLDVKKGDIYRG